MATSKCIFCGGTPTNREDVLPDWMGKYLMDNKPPPSGPGKVVVAKLWRGQTAFGDKPAEMSEWHTQTQPRTIARCVDEACNGGWMSDIESAAKPVLVPMIEGRTVALNQSDQEAVAKWLALKALTSQYTRAEQPPLIDEWVAGFYAEKRPPLTWQIRIGHYGGKQTFSMMGTSIDTTVRHPLAPFLFKKPGLMFVVVIGEFVGVVFITGDNQVVIPIAGYFVQIWPHALLRAYGPVRAHGDVETWPPECRLTDSQLEKCAGDPAEPRS